MELELFLKDPEYLKLKKEHEKHYFKLFGKYCKVDKNGITEKTASDMYEKFKNKKLSIQITEESTTKKGVTTSSSRVALKSFFEIWSNDPQIPEYDNIIFECDTSRAEKEDYNLFSGFDKFENQKSLTIQNLDPLFEHIKSLVNYDNDDYEYVLNWFAHLVQYPQKLPDTALVFISEEGIGKDMFAELLENTIGEKYFGSTEKLDQVCGKFNSILGGKLLMVLNETNPVESSQRIENIKAMITAKKLEIEEKYKTPIKCRNFCRFVFFSNRPFAFPTEEGSRRPKIMMGSNKYLPLNYGDQESADHFSNLDKTFQNPSFQYSFLQFLKIRDIQSFNPRKYKKSELHSLLVEASRDPLVSFMAEYVNDKGGSIRVKNTDFLCEYSFYLKTINYKFEMTPKKFTVDLKLKFNISTVKNSTTYYVIDTNYTKNILKQKYGYTFNNEIIINGDADNDDDVDYKDLYFKTLRKLEEIKQANKQEIHIKPVDDDLSELERDLESISVSEVSINLNQNIDSLDDLRALEKFCKKKKNSKK